MILILVAILLFFWKVSDATVAVITIIGPLIIDLVFVCEILLSKNGSVVIFMSFF